MSGLAAGSTALSAALSLVPDDMLTPVADQLADVSGWFVVIIAAIILQKILVTVSGGIAFTVIVPLACVLGIVAVYSRRAALRSLAIKLAAFGAVLVLAVPGSIAVSDALTSTYADAAAAASAADEAADSAAEAAQDAEADKTVKPEADDGDGGLLDSIGNWLEDAVGNVGSAVEGALNSVNEIKDEAVEALNFYMEQFALLIVTTCVMPILVMLLFSWVIKMLFSIDIRVGQAGRAVQARAAGAVRRVGRAAGRS
ncbi:MAG: hypothetical protein QM611_04805 [Microbacterium sp.]|uniref:hypothetical protein n=1 Tax=Microbacterium sp. TaxID=51671 RepID=UPI0039E65116